MLVYVLRCEKPTGIIKRCNEDAAKAIVVVTEDDI
jgi:hypothetical protein